MGIEEFTDEQQKIIDKVEKLLRLAARNTNSEEAAAATAKAQELLAAYNLDASMVSGDEDKSAKREKMTVKGGMYEFQRDLYRAVAQLNFCLYWPIMDRKYRMVNKMVHGVKVQREVLGKEFKHYIVGRLVNTRSTRMMAEYLTQTVERLVNERYENAQRWMAEAVAYREGIVYSVVNRLNERRREAEVAERRKAADEQARAGVSTSQALTLSTYKKQEQDANMDFVYGEGYTARMAAERAERARLAKEADEAHAKWAAANPEEAKKQAAEAAKENRKRSYVRDSWSPRYRQPTATERRQDSGSFWQGVDVGKKVSIDPQVSDRPASAPARIGRK